MTSMKAQSNGASVLSTGPDNPVPGQMIGVRGFRGLHDAALLIGVRVGGATSWQCFMIRTGHLRLEGISTAWLRELR